MIEIRRHNFGWDAASAILHALLFLLLVTFTPVRRLVLPERRPEPSAAERMSPEKIERLDEQLAEARSRELSRLLDDLQTVLLDMEVVRDQLRLDFDDVVREVAGDVRDELRRTAAAVRELQREAIAGQDAAAKTVERMVAAEKGDLDKTAAEAQQARDRLVWHEFEAVSASQAGAQSVLDRVRAVASFAGYEKVAETAAELRDVQIEAAKVQREESKGVTDPIRPFDDYRWAVQDLEAAESWAERERANRTNQQEKREQEKAQAKDAAERRDAAETRRAEAEARNDAKAEREARAERDRAERNRADAENRAKDAERRAEDAGKRIAEADRRVEETRARVDRIKRHAQEIDADAQTAAVRKAREAQQGVLDAMERLDAAIESDAPAPQEHVWEDEIPGELASRDLSDLTLSEAYEMARTLEEAITETYREVAAASTAIEQHLSLEEAEDLTDVAKPVREEIDADLLDGRARTAEELAAQKEARYDAVREAENMVDASVSMLDDALRLAGAGGVDGLRGDGARGRGLRRLRRGDLAGRDRRARTDRFIALSGLAGQLAGAAAESGTVRARDMTALTRIASRAQAPDAPPSREASRDAGHNAHLHAAAEPAARPSGAGTGPELLPGNVLSFDEASGGRPGAWMYLNAWWVIGPFPNPDRVNLTRKFPPESAIDLNAAYQGADGPVRWQFVQARNDGQGKLRPDRAEVSPPGSPEYTIWYGWTQLVVDSECDAWLAAGSDDRSDIWVNGMKVWASGNELKQWSINEGFRRVHLREGANEVLVRVENGHWNCGFSLCVSPHDAPPPL